MPDMYGPEDFGLFVSVSLDPRDVGGQATLQVPDEHLETVVEVLRAMAVDVADRHLSAGAGQWNALDKRAPGLIEERQLSSMSEEIEHGRQALRFLQVMAPVIDEDDDDDSPAGHDTPDPSSSASA